MPPSRGQRTGNLDKMCAARVYTSCIRVRLNKKNLPTAQRGWTSHICVDEVLVLPVRSPPQCNQQAFPVLVLPL